MGLHAQAAINAPKLRPSKLNCTGQPDWVGIFDHWSDIDFDNTCYKRFSGRSRLEVNEVASSREDFHD